MVRTFAVAAALLAGCAVPVEGDDYELSRGETERPIPTPDYDLTTGLPAQAEERPELFDVGESTLACSALDILFVVDNSGSMQEEQEKLADVVSYFVTRLQDLGLGVAGGMHVGVVTTDEYAYNQPDSCRHLGALVTANGDELCGPWSHGRYITEDDDLAQGLPCASSVGIYGSGQEYPVRAALEAIDGFFSQPGYCNEGFHRRGYGDKEPAGLVIVFLTDEDAHESGKPEDWWLRLVYEHGGDNISLFALIDPVYTCFGECGLLERFVQQAPYGYVGDIRKDDYRGFFDTAVTYTAGACGLDIDPVP